MDSLFGDGTPTAIKFLVAFAVVFALIAVTAWLIRRFGSGALGGTGARGRAPRLAVIEAGAVDGRRKLVLIRRDNIEHLIMIGGPTDIVVEANIVRGQSPRESAVSRPSSATESLPRTPSVEESAWPLQPEVTPRPTRATRPAPIEDTTHWALPPEPAAPATPAAPPKRSRSAETLAGLAAELSIRPSEPAASAPRPAPTLETPRAKAPPVPAPMTPSASDQNLADMASRLEAALRRPAPAPTPPPPARPAPAPKPAAEAPRAGAPVAPPVVPPVAPPAAPKVPAPPKVPAVTAEPEAKPAADKPAADKPAADKPAKPDDVFGSIEEEMANLLGRPSGKPS